MDTASDFKPQRLWFLPLFIFAIYAAMQVTTTGLAALPNGFDALLELGLPLWITAVSMIDGALNSIPYLGSVLGFVGAVIWFVISLLPSPSFDFPAPVMLMGKLMGVIGIYSFVGFAFLMGVWAAVDRENYPN